MSNKLGKLISKQLSNLSLPTRYDYTILLYHIIIGNCEDISEISKVPTIPNPTKPGRNPWMSPTSIPKKWWCPSSLAKLVNISPITRVDEWGLYL